MAEARAVPEDLEEVLDRPFRPRFELRPSEEPSRLDEGAGRQGVRPAQDLVVPLGLWPPAADFEQFGLDVAEGAAVRPRQVDGPFEVPFPGEAIGGREALVFLLRQDRLELFRSPEVGQSLMAAGVGVVGGGEQGARGEGLVEAANDAGGHRGEALIPQSPRGQGIGPQGHGLVVQHLLEMGDGPGPVDAVSKDAALEMVVEPAQAHGLQRQAASLLEPGLGFDGQAVEHEQERRMGRELRPGTEAPEDRVEGGAQSCRRFTLRNRQDPLVAGIEGHDLPMMGFEELQDPSGDGEERWPPGPRRRGRVGQGEQGLPLRAEEDVERPAAAPGLGHEEGHQVLVDVGPGLPVHLDADEMRVEKIGRGGVRERLPGHDMAPMAR